MSAPHPGEACEPCGDCRWCEQRWGYKRAAEVARAQNRRLAGLLRAASNALSEELRAAGADEVKQHPTLTDHQRLVARIERALERLSDRGKPARPQHGATGLE